VKGLKPALRGTKVPFDSAAAGRRWPLVLSRSQYVGDTHLLRYARLLGTLTGEG
jgi:hypothetical protein